MLSLSYHIFRRRFILELTYEKIVDAVRKRFKDTDVSNVPGTLAYQFNVEGKGQGIFYVEIKDGKLSVEPYEYYDRNAILIIKGSDLIKLINGKLDPVMAFTANKLKVEGDIGAALELIKFLK